MLGLFWVFPFQFTHVILQQERSPELTRDLRSFIRNGAGWSLTSPLLPATLVPQEPCWETSALSLSGLPQMRRGCACFPAASPKRDAREKCPCLSAGPHRWLHFTDIQDMAPTHRRGTPGLYMPRSTTLSHSAEGKRPVLELLIWHNCRLTGNILVLGSVTPIAAGRHNPNYLSPSV